MDKQCIVTYDVQGIVIDAGGTPSGHVIGVEYWRSPGPFVQYLKIPGSWGRFLGFWKVMASAAYAFSNVENVTVAAGETEAPRRNIPKAAKRVFWRILLFYSRNSLALCSIWITDSLQSFLFSLLG